MIASITGAILPKNPFTRRAQRWTSEPRETYEFRAPQHQDAIRAYKAEHPNASIRAIAAGFRCSAGTVHRALKALQDA